MPEYNLLIHVCLDSIIDETQSGFMKNRHISNLRLVLDLLDYSKLVPENSFILFLDFYKAFDTTENQFIFYSLKLFSLGYFSLMPLKPYSQIVIALLKLYMVPPIDLT